MFLQSITLDSMNLPEGYPFEVPVVQALTQMTFETPVTLFVGENGSGKSTLIEAIACGLKCPTVGAADVNRDPLLAPARQLAAEIRFARSRNPKVKLFFRAEDAIGFTRRVQDDMRELARMEAEYERDLKGYAQTLAKGVVSGQRRGYEDRYGENPDARSHGEWFINMLRERIHRPGLYLLDEPETPLSPIHQLTLLSIIMQAVNLGAQFIIATHSPMLMAFPGATIYEFDEAGISQTHWEDVEHVAIMKAFLADPEAYLRHL